MNDLFFELIRFSIGTQSSLSRMPSAKEWEQLYTMAQKQSLIGICFAGVKKLCNFEEEYYAGMNEMLYLTWMGMAAKIQQRNEVVNRQCVELQKRLSADGIGNCILKGQGVGARYGELSQLRQSGDVDVWVDCSREYAVEYVQNIAPTNEVNHKHVQLHCFPNTDVELHFIAAELHCPWQNWNLQRFFTSHNQKECIALDGAGEIYVPCLAFNIVHLLTHTYRHLFGDGIGLRQVMDLYFVFRYVPESYDYQEVLDVVRKAGMEHFASAMMWVLGHVYGISMINVPWGPNHHDGQFLLNEIMATGNFGKYDERIDRKGESRGYRFWRVTKQNWRLLRFSPWEVVFTPLWRIWHFVWMRSHGYTQG